MAFHPVITDCAGASLSAAERRLFEASPPFGFILFQRNCNSPEQVRALTAELREVAGRDDVPILIDREGGRVARLRPPAWRLPPPASVFGDLAMTSPEAACEAARLNARLIARDLRDIGITVDCLPLLDLRLEGADLIIGDRSYGGDPARVAMLGRATCEGLAAGGVVPVIKHIPGHGRAESDSHLALPRVDAAHATLAVQDFAPFIALRDMPVAMTAHIIYAAIDPDHPATTSQRVIKDVIRGEIGFQGLLLSDDISMKALTGPLPSRVTAALGAGCDILLHCNGTLEDRAEVLAAAPVLPESEFRRLSRFITPAVPQQPFDRSKALAQLDRLLGQDMSADG